MMKFKRIQTFLLTLTTLVGASAALAHNQAPATIRRSMERAFQTLDAPLPANVFKGQKAVRVGGATAQVFEAKKDGALKGFVAQLEYREQVHVVAIDKTSGEVKAVVRDGTNLSEEEWKDLSFLPSLKSALLGAK